MVELTPNLLEGSFIGAFGILFVSLGFQVYMLYLNYKQSKVKSTTEQLIEQNKEIINVLKEIRNKLK